MARAAGTSAALSPLEQALQEAGLPERFAAVGDLDPGDPGLVVPQIGAISSPISPSQAKRLLEVAHESPYGRGEQTLHDPKVRRGKELDPREFSLAGEDWETIERVLAAGMSFELGFDEPLFDAHLYKLLIYERGGFFLPHRDGERVTGMVASLVLTLPGKFTGGELVVRQGGRQVTANWQGAAKGKCASFAVFYADCEHEVRPVTSGHRISLVYHLTVKRSRRGQFRRQTPGGAERLVPLLEQALAGTDGEPLLAIPLEHQYTAQGLSPGLLKGNDRGVAQRLFEAAESGGWTAWLARMTWQVSGGGDYASGPSAYDRRRRYRHAYEDDDEFGQEDTDSEDEGTATRDGIAPRPSKYVMLDICEEQLTASQWCDSRGKHIRFGELPIAKSSVLGDMEDWAISREEFEGYTGNAGMELERWYHRAAIVLWPNERRFDVLVKLGIAASLAELRRMRRRAANLPAAREFAARVLGHWAKQRFNWHEERSDANPPDYRNPLPLLVGLGDVSLVDQYLSQVARERPSQTLATMAETCQALGWQELGPSLTALCEASSQWTLPRNVEMQSSLVATSDGSPESTLVSTSVAESLIAAVIRLDGPASADQRVGWQGESARPHVIAAWASTLVNALMTLKADRLLDRLLRHFESRPVRYGPREVQLALVKSLRRKLAKSQLPAVTGWLGRLRAWFEQQTAAPPSPPTDSIRQCGIPCSCRDCARLIAFMADPRATVLELPLTEDRRRHLHVRIEEYALDLTHVTRRQGRPYVLVCKKTDASYHRAVQVYQEDLKRLTLFEGLPAARPAESATRARATLDG